MKRYVMSAQQRLLQSQKGTVPKRPERSETRRCFLPGDYIACCDEEEETEL